MRYKMKMFTLVLAAIIAVLSVKIYMNSAEQDQNVSLRSGNKHTSKVVNVYTSRKEALIKAVFDEFTTKTGIKVNYIMDDSSKLIARMEHEQEATQADVFLTTDVTNLCIASNKGLLTKIDSKLLRNSVPEELRDENWIALTKRSTIIVYSKDRVDPSEINSLEDLAKPKWEGRLVVRSSNSPYTQSLISWFIHRFGEYKTREIVRGFVKNMARKPRGGDTDQIRAIALGEGDITVVNNYYLARMMASNIKADREAVEKVGLIFPNAKNGGTMNNISGAGITKFAKNKDNAVRLLEFMLKPVVQRLYAEQNHEYPIVDGIRPSTILESWGNCCMDTSSLKNFAVHSDLAILIADEEGWR